MNIHLQLIAYPILPPSCADLNRPTYVLLLGYDEMVMKKALI
jgi:hypothetical protein